MPESTQLHITQALKAMLWRLAFAWIHGVVSLLFLAGYGLHQLAALRQPRIVEVPDGDVSLNPS